MTVVELTPVQIYGLLMLAVVNLGMAALIWREFMKAGPTGERIAFALALVVILGLPVGFGVAVMLGVTG